jgi:hypothetical protein
MITDAERDTFAAALWAKHGDDLPRYVAIRLGEQVMADDAGGVAFWQDIAARADALMRVPRQ